MLTYAPPSYTFGLFMVTWNLQHRMDVQPDQPFVAYEVTLVPSYTGKTVECTGRYAAGLQLSAESGVVPGTSC